MNQEKPGTVAPWAQTRWIKGYPIGGLRVFQESFYTDDGPEDVLWELIDFRNRRASINKRKRHCRIRPKSIRLKFCEAAIRVVRYRVTGDHYVLSTVPLLAFPTEERAIAAADFIARQLFMIPPPKQGPLYVTHMVETPR